MMGVLTKWIEATALCAFLILAVSTAAEPPEGEGEPFRIVAFGDSVTKGTRAGVAPEQTFAARLEEALKPTFPMARVLNAGIGGNTVRHAWSRIITDVVEKRPAFCTLMFGINDSYFDEGATAPRISIQEYEQRLRNFVTLLRYHAIEPILMTPNPMTSRVAAIKRAPYKDEAKGMNFMLEQYCERVHKVAREMTVPLIDVYRRFWENGRDEAGVDRLLTDGMHPNPAGHQLIADMLADFFKKAMRERADRPLPTPRAAENLRKAQEKLSSFRWITHAIWEGNVLPHHAKPSWSPGRGNLDMARIEEGAMCLANVPGDAKRALSFTLNLPTKEGALAVTYRAKISADSVGSPYLSVANGHTKIWTRLEPQRFLVTRFDGTKDRVEIPMDCSTYHTYRVALADMDLYVFVDDMKKPAVISPGWLVPSEEGRYVQFAVATGGKPCESHWARIEISYADGPSGQ